MSADENPYGGLPNAEQLVANAARFLVDGGENDAALLLVSCDVELVWGEDYPNEGQFNAILTCPRAVYDTLDNYKSLESNRIVKAMSAVAPMGLHCRYIIPKVSVMKPDEIPPGWRQNIVDHLEGKSIHNQGRQFGSAPRFEWNNLYFRSEAEKRVAMILDKTGVLFFPNCMGRVKNEEGVRETREPDFLVCDRGKWGIMEIDGQAYHRTAAIDHQRDRGFRSYGIRVVERFTATECFEDAPGVVKRFLQQLERNG